MCYEKARVGRFDVRTGTSARLQRGYQIQNRTGNTDLLVCLWFWNSNLIARDMMRISEPAD
jgi:hypothetical protein